MSHKRLGEPLQYCCSIITKTTRRFRFMKCVFLLELAPTSDNVMAAPVLYGAAPAKRTVPWQPKALVVCSAQLKEQPTFRRAF